MIGVEVQKIKKKKEIKMMSINSPPTTLFLATADKTGKLLKTALAKV